MKNLVYATILAMRHFSLLKMAWTMVRTSPVKESSSESDSEEPGSLA